MTTSRYRERNSTADRALDILLMFDEHHLAISAVEVAEQLDVARSTAYRYLQSLVSSRFLEESAAGRFRLGGRVMELARFARQGVGLSEITLPLMRGLAAEIGETVLLTRLAGNVVICLEREEASARVVRISYERGQVLPINAGASAFVLLAWLDTQALDRILTGAALHRFTPATIVTDAALRQRLAETAQQGYGISRGELDVDVLGVAAPVRDARDQVIAAISVAAVASRIAESGLPDVVEKVRGAANEASASIALAS